MQKIVIPTKGDILIALRDMTLVEKKYSNSSPTEISTTYIRKGQVLRLIGGHNAYQDDGKVSLHVLEEDRDHTFGIHRGIRREALQLLISQFNNKFAFADESVLEYLKNKLEEDEDRFSDIEI